MHECIGSSVIHAMMADDDSYIAQELYDYCAYSFDRDIYLESVNENFEIIPGLLRTTMRSDTATNMYVLTVHTLCGYVLTIHTSNNSGLLDASGGILQFKDVYIGKHILTYSGGYVGPGRILDIKWACCAIPYYVDLYMDYGINYPIIDGAIVPPIKSIL